MTIFWIILAIALFVFEAATPQLISIWFAIGAVAASVTSLFGGVIAQTVIFIIVTLTTLIATRPIVKKKLMPKVVATNFDRLIGKVGVVKEDVDNINGTGMVMVERSLWSAKSFHNEVIPSGTNVSILSINGVKLTVKPLNETPVEYTEINPSN